MQQTIDVKYLGGMNEDVNPLDAKSTSFYNARNFNNLDSDGSNFGNEVNIDGNRLLLVIPDIAANPSLNIPAQANLKIIGLKSIDDIIVVFTTNNADTKPVDTYGQIWVFKYNPKTSSITNYANALVYNGLLDFSVQNKITSIEISYKGPNDIFVYWADRFNLLRGCNVMDPELYTYDVNRLELLSNMDLIEANVTGINSGGGFMRPGAIQYTYRLKKNTIYSGFAPASKMYTITDGNANASSSSDIKGLQPEGKTNKSVTISVNITDNNSFYNEIEIYRVLHTFYNDPPIISLVNIGSMVKGEYTFIDTGVISLGDISHVELSNIRDLMFVPEWITSNENILFTTNNKDKFFDVDYDARSYRFLYNSNDAKIYKYKPDTTPTDVYSSSLGWVVIDDDADAVTYSYLYKFKKNSTTFGGDGPNVSYEFITSESRFDDDYNGSQMVVYGDKAGANSYTSMNIRNYQRGETYRFGIVFINERGNPSFVKWIADVKFPNANDFPVVDDTSNYPKPSAYNLGIKFYVNNIPTNTKTNKPYSFKIVRVNRGEIDRTVVDQVVPLPTTTDSSDVLAGTRYRSPFPAYRTNINTNYYSLYSPNVSYFNESDRRSYNGLTLDVQSLYYGSSEVNKDKNDTSGQFSGNYEFKATKAYKRYDGSSSNIEIDDSEYIDSAESKFVGGKKYYNYLPSDIDASIIHKSGSCTAVKLEYSTILNPTIPSTLSDRWRAYVCNVVRENDSQYGGNSYNSRSLNTYISASEMINPTSQQVIVESFSGDTFIGPFQILNFFSYTDFDDPLHTANKGFLDVLVVPLESPINLYLNSTTTPLGYWHDLGTMIMASYQEYEGVYTYTDGTVYDQPFSAYVYNSVYSKPSNTFLYIAKPFNYKEKQLCGLIRYSEKSTQNNQLDLWRVFKTNNYQSVDSNFGCIKSIHKWNDKILFFQENAFGVMNVNERLTQQNINDVSIVLGTGDTLSKAIYKSHKNGSIHGESVSITNNSILFYDNIENGIMMYQVAYTGASSAEISKVGGINKTIKNRFNNNTRYENKLLYSGEYQVNPPFGQYTPITEHVGVNSIVFNSDIYMSLFDYKSSYNTSGILEFEADYDTVKFDATLKKFTSYFDFSSPVYGKIKGDLLSVHPTTLNSIWVFNNAEKGSFYGTKYPSTITMLVNGNNSFNKLFTNIEYVTDVEDTVGTDLRLETFDKAHVWNEHQDTGEFDIVSGGNARRRTRRWHLTIPRALQFNPTDRKDSRIRGRYLYMKFIYDNNLNKKITLSNMSFKYSLSREDAYKLSQTPKQQ